MCVYCVKCTKFGKLFLRKVIKTVATRWLDFSSKHPKMHLAAGLRQDPLGELKRSPTPPNRKMGPTSKGRGREGRREGRGGILPDQSKYGCYGPVINFWWGSGPYTDCPFSIFLTIVEILEDLRTFLIQSLPNFYESWRMTDADKIINPQHFVKDTATSGSGLIWQSNPDWNPRLLDCNFGVGGGSSLKVFVSESDLDNRSLCGLIVMTQFREHNY